MTDDNTEQTPLPLSQLNVATVRRENEHVDETIDSLESDADTLKQKVASLEDDLEAAENRAEQAEKLLGAFEEGQRADALERIKTANEAVADEDEVDLSSLEDASVDQLETVAEIAEAAAAAAGEPVVSNTESTPDLTDTDSGEPSFEDELAEKAEEWGLGRQYEKLREGDHPSPATNFASGESTVATDLPDGGISRGASGDIPMDDIMEALNEADN